MACRIVLRVRLDLGDPARGTVRRRSACRAVPGRRRSSRGRRTHRQAPRSWRSCELDTNVTMAPRPCRAATGNLPVRARQEPGSAGSSRTSVKRSSWPATGIGPAPPGVVRRVTATPGATSAAASGPRRSSAATSVGQRRLPRQRPPHERADDGVGVTERGAPLDEPLGEVGGRDGLGVGGGLHPLGQERRRGDHPGHRRQAERHLPDRVEQRLLVLLQVAVVRQRQALQRHQQAGEVADQPAGLAAHQLGDVGVLLLRQHRRAGGVGVVEAGEAELVAGPQHPLLAHPGQVDAEQGEVEQTPRRRGRGR